MLVRAYLDTAKDLVLQYTGKPPLSIFLSAFFKQHKRFGSRDRKYIADLVFGYFRLGKQTHLHLEDALIIGACLKSRLPQLFFEIAKPELVPLFDLPLEEKMAALRTHYPLQFEIHDTLSMGLSEADYFQVLYSPSRVFLRLRQKKNVLHSLKQHQIDFLVESADCISVSADTKLDNLLDDRDFVIQDFSSQRTGDYWHIEPNSSWWDCCAASGGKALRLLDCGIPIQLQVSDIRTSIIHNLEQRLTRYGYKNKYYSKVLDLMESTPPQGPFDAIIADVPCSGSGTWGRSPEGLYFNTLSNIQAFHEKQVRIACNAARHLKKGGRMYYITCSVFALENELAVNAIEAQSKLCCVDHHLLHTPGIGADILYTAILEKR